MDRRLSDTERKVHRILVNTSHFTQSPSITEISRWSGRSIGEVRKALDGLEEKEYVRWRRKNQIELLRKKEKTEVDLLFEERLGW